MLERDTGFRDEQQLTTEAVANYTLIASEAKRRRAIGLTQAERLDAYDQVCDYLGRLRAVDPQVDARVDALIQGKKWQKSPELIICMPAVGTGNQEATGIQNTLLRLNTDPYVQSGDVGVLVFVNRPSGYAPDCTGVAAYEIAQQTGMNAIILESDVPATLGNIDGPFQADMATEQNEVAIGLIRDMLNIAAMKLALQSQGNLPLLLQMDADFEGFMKGSCEDILSRFADPSVRFLQCTSDWDSQDLPRESDFELWLGTELMRELPQILKIPLNEQSLPSLTQRQVLFGEAIQRGIQVPQVERMEDIARKGGYGLNRLAHDELDANIRQAALLNPAGVRSTSKIVFLWNNRRAVRSWKEYQQPPISQWVNPFAVIDPVRSAETSVYGNGQSHVEAAINKSLARFPIPRKLAGVYEDFTIPVLDVVTRIYPSIQGLQTRVLQKGSGLYYLQVDFHL